MPQPFNYYLRFGTPVLQHLTDTSRHNGDKCVITRYQNSLIASHLILKHMGSDGVKDTVTRFCGVHAAPGIHRFNPQIGILLISLLDKLVDLYQLSFYHVTVSYNRMFGIMLFNISAV